MSRPEVSPLSSLAHPLGDTSAELSSLVKAWRRRLKPEDIPGFSRYPARRRSMVSQDDVARLVGSTSFWYGELERGQLGRYSDDFLDRVSVALRLSDAERYVLYQYAVGRDPAPRGVPSGEVSSTMDRIIQRQQWPAYLSNSAWDVLTWNPLMKVWFPWMPSEPNVMRWVFTYPEARDQLADWREGWAGPMIAQMRLAHAREPENDRLTELIREILELNDEARDLWDRSPEVKVHPDGDIRGIYLPGRDNPIQIEVVAFTPMRDLSLRAVLLIPVEQDTGEMPISRLRPEPPT